MKKIIILIAIFCCIVNARVLTYSKTINHVTCTVRVNPEKGRVDVGKCNIWSIRFMDKDDMMVTAYDDTLIANSYYSKIEFFEDMNDLKDIVKIIVKFVEPVENVDKTMARNARKNHFHEASDGGWECDDGYIWSNKGTYCVKDKGFNKNNCPPAWQNDDGSCKKGW